MNFGPYSLGKFKEAPGFGREGTPAQGNLLKNGVQIGNVYDDGNGGCAYTRNVSEKDYAELEAYVATLPPEPDVLESGPMPVDLDFFLGMLLSTESEKKEIAKAEKSVCKRLKKKGFHFAVIAVKDDEVSALGYMLKPTKALADGEKLVTL